LKVIDKKTAIRIARHKQSKEEIDSEREKVLTLREMNRKRVKRSKEEDEDEVRLG
jgi:hypothetical protein